MSSARIRLRPLIKYYTMRISTAVGSNGGALKQRQSTTRVVQNTPGQKQPRAARHVTRALAERPNQATANISKLPVMTLMSAVIKADVSC